MLLGLLYCPSNREQRASKFYELVEIELSNILSVGDEEFRKYVPIMYEVVYIFMFRMYEKHREPGIDESTGFELMPEIDIEDYLPEPGKGFVQLNKKLLRLFVN